MKVVYDTTSKEMNNTTASQEPNVRCPFDWSQFLYRKKKITSCDDTLVEKG